MAIRVGINGFGLIGRDILRTAIVYPTWREKILYHELALRLVQFETLRLQLREAVELGPFLYRNVPAARDVGAVYSNRASCLSQLIPRIDLLYSSRSELGGQRIRLFSPIQTRGPPVLKPAEPKRNHVDC
jgi:hypothetical protein